MANGFPPGLINILFDNSSLTFLDFSGPTFTLWYFVAKFITKLP